MPLAAVLAGILIAVNLRPAVTSMAAAFPALGDAFGPSLAGGSPLLFALGSAPLVAFGLSALLGPWLARRWGLGRTLSLAMLVLAAALVLRVASPALMLPGTVLAGVMIMVGSVLVPQLVKEHGGATWFSGVTAMCIGGGAALGAGLLSPLASAVGLPGALASWAVPAAAAAVVVHLALRQGAPAERTRSGAAAPARGAGAGGAGAWARSASAGAGGAGGGPTEGGSLLRSRTALAIAGYFGVQAMLFFTVTSWLPTFLTDRGADAAAAAGLLAWFNLAGLPVGLAVPLLLARSRWRAAMGPALGAVLALTFLWLPAAPLSAMAWPVAALGIAQSGAFSYSLAMLVVRTADARTAGRLSALSQGAGYTLAAAGPFAAGALVQATGGWDAPFLVMAALAVALTVLGAAAARGPAVGVQPGGQPGTGGQPGVPTGTPPAVPAWTPDTGARQ
ncbi:MFS transporter [Sinomonas halotolerans]